MDYSFKRGNDFHKIKLDDYSFIYENNDGEQRIRYAQINRVRLARPKSVDKNNLYTCSIYITDGPVIRIQSYTLQNNEIINQFNYYNQFIRVLHLYLVSKSMAKFRYGMSYRSMIVHSIILVAALAACYALSLLLREHVIYIFSIVPLLLAFIIIKILTDKPGSYRPDIIPYNILPGI